MRPVKLLLDENLSPAVAQKLRGEGFDVVHVRDRGLLAGTDAEVLDKAFHEDRIAVTLNVGDFVLLAGAAEVHAGLVLVEPAGLLRDEQEMVIRRALEMIASEYEAGRDLVNRALRIEHGGSSAFEELPSRD